MHHSITRIAMTMLLIATALGAQTVAVTYSVSGPNSPLNVRVDVSNGSGTYAIKELVFKDAKGKITKVSIASSIYANTIGTASYTKEIPAGAVQVQLIYNTNDQTGFVPIPIPAN